MTDAQHLEVLRRVAEEATPGPWTLIRSADGAYVRGDYYPTLYVAQDAPSAEERQRNAAFAVTFHPPTCLALITELLRLREQEAAGGEASNPDPVKPVAWRVKDFADGWILCHTEAQARAEAEGAGNLVQPLYAYPSASPCDPA